MGMTKAFYFIRNRKQTQEELEQQLNGFKAVMQQYSIEDFGFDEEFSTDFPDVLCQCGFDGDSLRRVWSLDNYYESDLLYDMFDEMKTFPVFEPDEGTPDGVSVIDGETVFDGE